MTQRTENRIWRGLFLAVLLGGCGVAATSGARADKVVGGFANGMNGRSYLIMESGNVAEFQHDYEQGQGQLVTVEKFRWLNVRGLFE